MFLSLWPVCAKTWRLYSQKIFIESWLCARSFLRKQEKEGLDGDLEKWLLKLERDLGNYCHDGRELKI